MKPHPALRASRRQAGVTLAATMIVVAAIVTFLGIAAAITSQYGRYAGRQQGSSMEAAFCDSALEYAYAQWKVQMTTLTNAGTLNVPASSLPLNATDFLTNAYPYASQMSIDTSAWVGARNGDCFAIYAVDQNGYNSGLLPYTALSASTSLTNPQAAPAGLPTKNVPGYPGWSGTSYNYKAVVKIHSNHYGMDPTETYQAVRYFQATQLPLCQGLAFYEGNMEIHPGATMVLNGPIHSNGKIWAAGFATVQFKANISDVGGYYDGTSNPAVKYGWGGNNSSPIFPDPYAPYYPVLYADGKSKSASAVAATEVNTVSPINPFGGDNAPTNNALRSIITVPAATNTSTQIAYNQAALVITVDSTQIPSLLGITTNIIPPSAILIQVRNAAGVLVTATGSDYTNVMAAINNGQDTPFVDKREAATVYATNLDMTKLLAATSVPASVAVGTTINSSNATPLQAAFNQVPPTTDPTTGQAIRVPTGTVYIHDAPLASALTGLTGTARSGATRSAIRLTNGAALGENVSVASDNGMYIQGDYNTGIGTASNPVPSDQPGAATSAVPQITGYSRYAASVMADAVTVLSNNWHDINSSTAISTRTATPTTVNTAILAGDVASNTNNSGIASGGVHNFPRFLENWTNINFTYYGTLIEAFNSTQFTGYWQTGDVYTWPNRLWNFDTNFTNLQPPGLPQGTQFSRGRWERGYLPTNS